MDNYVVLAYEKRVTTRTQSAALYVFQRASILSYRPKTKDHRRWSFCFGIYYMRTTLRHVFRRMRIKPYDLMMCGSKRILHIALQQPLLTKIIEMCRNICYNRTKQFLWIGFGCARYAQALFHRIGIHYYKVFNPKL